MKRFAVLLALLALGGVAEAQTVYRASGYRFYSSASLPAGCHDTTDRLCLWIPSTGPNANKLTLHLADGTDTVVGSGGGGSGSVTSVGMTVPSWLSVSGSPITSSGTLAVSANVQSANFVLAAPSGASGAPSFRALVDSDIPTTLSGHTLGATTITGTLATNRTSNAAIDQFALVKFSTTAGRVQMLGATDSASLMTGVALTAAGSAGVSLSVQEVQGVETSMISDGTTTIAVGDQVQPSSTIAGRVMKGATNPICTATSAAAATPGTVFTCL